jgi:predicted nucleic acid-binding protein
MATLIKKYVIDACALIAYFRDEDGADKLEALFEAAPHNKFFMHAVNLGEVYYDSLRVSGKEKAQALFEDVAKLPITLIWDLDEYFIELIGKYKTSYRVSYADCFLLALAERENAIVISTDHHEFDVIDNTGELAFYWLRGRSDFKTRLSQ